jgi:hypothetical protein
MDRRDALRAVAHAVLHACVVEKLAYVFLTGNAFVAEGPTRETNRVGAQLALHRNPALFAALDHAQTVGEGAEDPLFVLRDFTLQKSQPVLPKLGVAEHLMNLRLLQRFLALGTVQFAQVSFFLNQITKVLAEAVRAEEIATAVHEEGLG